jgi:hypothetical protein
MSGTDAASIVMRLSLACVFGLAGVNKLFDAASRCQSLNWPSPSRSFRAAQHQWARQERSPFC